MPGNPPIGIMGGTGLYEILDMDVLKEVEVNTPFGQPSECFVKGVLEDTEVVFLARHGRGHRYPACGVNYRANVFGFKSLGVDTVISLSAVGSMKDDYEPLDVVIPDQFFDRTWGRQTTFFETTPAVHVDLADPICPVVSEALYQSCREVGVNVHKGGTYLCMEGPGFSTRAESKVYRSWGVDVIGMTGAPEMKLCREAEICYGTLALVTDYDVWKEDADDVTIEAIVDNLHRNAEAAKRIVKDAIKRIPRERPCSCREALKYGIVTHPALIPDTTRRELSVLIGKYLPVEE